MQVMTSCGGVCRKLPSDFEPYGERKWVGKRHEKPDCSICRCFQPLLRPGQLDWGTCANPRSPRAGLLTFWEQGCEQFEPEKDAGTEETRRTRSDFKNEIENVLHDALGEFTRAEVAKVNKPFPDDEFHVFRHEDKLDTIFFSQIPYLLRRTTADFDHLQAAEEMAAETRRDESQRFWGFARGSLARWLKRDASAIRLPGNTNGLEEEFWARVRAAFTSASRAEGLNPRREEFMKQRRDDEEPRRKRRIRRILGLRSERELRLTPGFQSHEALWAIAEKLPTDFEAYGRRRRSNGAIHSDCSCNCRWFHVLAGMRGQDWGVCANPKSPRAGLLTFEHMGCPQYEWDGREDYLKTASGKKVMKRFQEAEEELQAWRKTKQSSFSS